MISYYFQIAPVMLSHLTDRPIAFVLYRTKRVRQIADLRYGIPGPAVVESVV
ncbi:hypothetical protein [Kibdelosporangium persicum]|uniref:hypothetical protein n=1 Tax=Kibdelosporangium persicum TaxID=2698649 RepID=UPI0015660722|nr:hypothetical protein [Kibdelosporangium persicum]